MNKRNAPKKLLNQYRGRLSAGEISDGINAALTNGRRLLKDAKLMLENERFPTALALAVLAIEERGKSQILKNLALRTDPTGLSEAWKNYRNHRAKNASWILLDLVRAGARDLSQFADVVDYNGPHTVVLDALKQTAFYTDCLGNRHWSVPDTVIDKDLATSIVAVAEALMSTRAVTEREIELWVEHVRPHWAKGSMIQAILNWQRAMCAEGLSDTSPDALEAFIRGHSSKAPPNQ